MSAIASQITSLTIVYSIVYSDADQRNHQSSASLAFVWGIHRGPVNFPHKWPVTRKMFPFDGVIICVRLSGPWRLKSPASHLDCFFDRLFSAHHRKHHSPASLPFVRGNHRWAVDSPHNATEDSDSDSDNVYSTKIDTDTISGLQKTPIYNNRIFRIYNESNARCETSIKVISDRWHGGHPKRKSMHTQWENT